MTLEGKVALVTGGTRGIGLAIVKALRVEGCKVAVVHRSNLDEPDCEVLYIQRDLRVEDQCYGIAQKLLDKFGGIDILVNNAAAHQNMAPVLDWTNREFDQSLSLMLMAPFILSKLCAIHMKPSSHIINILSTSAFQGTRNNVGYVAAKHGLLGLTRALAVEWAPDIHVNAVAPGLTETDMIADMTPERRAFLKSITPGGKFCTPEDIAEAVLYLVNSKSIYGQVITVDNGWLARGSGG